MPRVRRRIKQRKGYSQTHYDELLKGQGFFDGWSLEKLKQKAQSAKYHNADNAELLVQQVKDVLVEMRELWYFEIGTMLPDWIAENPGTRPWAWWKFDAPERRKRIDGPCHPFDNPERIERVSTNGTELWDNNLSLGKPSILVVEDCFDAKYETQLDYLKRLDLLIPAEKRCFTELQAELESAVAGADKHDFLNR